jgi:membrane-associated phospholipid phosphatase
MKRKKNLATWYILFYLILVGIGGLFFLSSEKGHLELLFNTHHHSFLDQFFIIMTMFGDGAVLIPIILLLSLNRFSYAIFMLWTALIHMVLVFLAKNLIFKGAPRPAEFLKDVDFYRIPGFELHHWNSFPSGHTATAFAMTCGLAFIFSKNKNFQIALLLIGCLIGFSRVYLMQHFFLDVWAGSIVGVSSALIGREITIRYFSTVPFKKSIFKKPKPKIAKLRRQLTIQKKEA